MFQLHLQAQIFNKDGTLKTSKAWVSKSFVKNVLGCLAPNLDNGNYYSTVDTSANSRSNDEHGNLLYCPQGYGGGFVYPMTEGDEYKGDELGIQVGDGNAANTAITYTLHQQINHGTGLGELEYFGGCFDDIVTVNGDDTYFDIERIFRNSSGGTITVKEYAVVVFRQCSNSIAYPTLIIRDVFTDPGDWVDVDDTEFLKVSYRLLVTT